MAKSDQFIRLVQEIADSVAARGRGRGRRAPATQIDDLKVTLKENIELGQVVRIEAGDGQRRRHLPPPPGRPRRQRRHRRARRAAPRTSPTTSRSTSRSPSRSSSTATRSPADEVEEERRRCSSITQAEGKPEAALAKIVEGRLNGWYKERVLLEQAFVRDEKQTVAQLADCGGAEIVRFAQVVIGG